MYHSSFRKNHSAEFCLAHLIEFVLTGLDKQMHAGMILVDLQKAFETLEHGFFLSKWNILVFRRF